MAKYEHELSALDGLGLDAVETDDCLTCLLAFVRSCAASPPTPAPPGVTAP
jgi:hypothetical protein